MGAHSRGRRRAPVAYAARLDLVDRYLELGLRLGRHVDGLVDFYYGPSELAVRVEGEARTEPAELVRAADGLIAQLAEGGDGIADGQRRRWLDSQLGALRTVAGRLAGEDLSYVDEVERCYGIRPEHTPEERFEAAHRRLDEVLPGSGDLGERLRAWQSAGAVPPEAVLAAVEALADDFRERARRLVELPDGEAVEFDLVTEEPWAAYNYYRGGLGSRIAVNADVPMYAHFVGELVAHETYPGHHTEHATKEALLVRDRGYREETVALTATPQSVVSEAIAEVALDLLLGEEAQEVVAEHLRPLGVPYDPDVANAVLGTREALRSVGLNVALMLHQQGASEDEGRAYLRRWTLQPDATIEKSIQFVTDPTWRAYVACYSMGRRLARGFVGNDPDRFRRLLTEQLVPADLAVPAT